MKASVVNEDTFRHRGPAIEIIARWGATLEGESGQSRDGKPVGFPFQTGALGRRRSDDSNERRGGRRHGRRSRRSMSA